MRSTRETYGWNLADRMQHYTLPPDSRGCALWVGAKNQDGYGVVRHEGNYRRAHRVAYEQAKGAIPPGQFVCHSCDTPGCVSPDHLWLGSNADNMADKVAKGRQPRRLTAEQVREIRTTPGTGAAVGAKFNISRGHVWKIRAGHKWRHLSAAEA